MKVSINVTNLSSWLLSLGLAMQTSTMMADGIGTRGGMPPAPRPNSPEPANVYDCKVNLDAYGDTTYHAETRFGDVTPIVFRSKPADWKITSNSGDQQATVDQFPMGLEHDFTIAASNNIKDWLTMDLVANWGFFSNKDHLPFRNTVMTQSSLSSTDTLNVGTRAYINDTGINWSANVTCKYV